MKVKIEYWDRKNKTVVTETGFRYLDTSSEIKKVETWEGTKEEIFKRFDKQNNRLRYCNGSYYKFVDESLNQEYIKWYKGLDEGTKLNMFYSNGVVD
jgi:hypothetical protein